MADEGRETQTMQGIGVYETTPGPIHELKQFILFIESWVSVEEYKTGQLTHVRSSEEVAELLADAATEDKGSSEPLSVVETQFEEGKELVMLLHYNCCIL